jgi:hypothetical protein
MMQTETTKVKVTLGPVQLEYEGREDFLKSEIISMVQELDKLHTRSLIAPVNTMQADIETSLITQRDIANGLSALKNDLDSLNEMGEMESLRLQMAMERMSKMMSTLSNLMKKISDTASSITSNLK